MGKTKNSSKSSDDDAKVAVQSTADNQTVDEVVPAPEAPLGKGGQYVEIGAGKRVRVDDMKG